MIKQVDDFENEYIFPALPISVWNFGHVVCAEFYDWDKPKPDCWVAFAERLAEKLKIPLFQGSGGRFDDSEFIEEKSSGSWKRVRRKISNLISITGSRYTMDINSGYQYIVGEKNNDGYIIFDMNCLSINNNAKFCIVVGNEIAKSPINLISKLNSILKNEINPKWGAVYNFPKAASGNYYMSNAAFMGNDLKSIGEDNLTIEHMRRSMRARFRLEQFPYSKGYIREIHEFNFLSSNHLNAPFKNFKVENYIEKHGNLKKCDFFPDIWQWSLEKKELNKARMDWEDSGLVLSADKDPIIF